MCCGKDPKKDNKKKDKQAKAQGQPPCCGQPPAAPKTEEKK